ncbi:A-kinase anchor protein 8-like [Tachyglossus aculeatus]|uniref:A-kinase anchor protein 8-like n=1 Tax=Tachyglossus aculeatus TaxID=9261 RepID=UPI0018F722D9|nr:A-kinase anchor protein 8-like [Tachyglossus aculeatus]
MATPWLQKQFESYENYSYGYGYSQDNTSNYGYNMATSNSWEIPSTNTNANPSASTSSSTDTVLSKINQSLDMVTQRLDMVSHLEMDMMQGGLYGSGGDRFDSYDAYDSRATLNDRDIYRFDYDYSEIDPEMEMAYESHYDAYREQFQIRDSFGQRAQGWARDGRTNRSIAASYGRMWDDPMAARSHCGPGSSRLPSLFSQKIIPEYGMLQSMRGAYGNMRFGFGFGSGLKQMRRTWKTWGNADFKPQKKKNKKRKQSNSTDEPDSKAAKTDGSDNSDSENDEGTEGEGTETVEASEKVEKSSKEGEDDEGKDDGKEDGKPDPEKGTLTIQEEISQIKRKLQAGKKTQERQKKRQRDRMVESSGPDTAWHLCPEAPALRALCMPRGPPHWCLPPPQVLALAGSSSAKSAPGPWALQTKLFPWPSYGWQRIQFVCSLCKYRTFYEDEMTNHLDSKFHKEHFKFVGTKLPKQTADFLEEYVTNKTKKTEDRRKAIENLNGVIQQIYKDQDLTQEIGMEHFVKKVEAAHCAACDLFIPMQFGIIQKHLKTMEHNRNRRKEGYDTILAALVTLIPTSTTLLVEVGVFQMLVVRENSVSVPNGRIEEGAEDIRDVKNSKDKIYLRERHLSHSYDQDKTGEMRSQSPHLGGEIVLQGKGDSRVKACRDKLEVDEISLMPRFLPATLSNSCTGAKEADCRGDTGL